MSSIRPANDVRRGDPATEAKQQATVDAAAAAARDRLAAFRDGLNDGLSQSPAEIEAGREADEARDQRRWAVMNAQGHGAPDPVTRGRQVWLQDGMRERHMESESAMTALAGQAVGVQAVFVDSLNRFADERAWAGGVRVDLDPVREASEELADCRSYLVWGIQDAMEQMDDVADAGDEYARLMRALGHVQQAWAALHGG